MTEQNADGYNSPPPSYNGYGNPDNVPTAENPSILPTWWPAAGGEAFDFVSVAQFLTTNPRLQASCIATVGGSVTNGDTVGAALSNAVLPGGAVVVTTQATGSDTATTLAARLALLLSSNPVLQSFGIIVTTTGATLTVYWPGPLGNLATLSAWSYVQEETATIGGTVTTSDITSLIFGNLGAANSAELSLTGTVTTGDVLTVTFYHKLLTNGQISATYTTLGGDTLTTIATAIQTAIAAASLGPLSLTSNAAGPNVFISWNSAIGTVYINALWTRAATETVAVVSQAGTAPSPLAPSPAPSDLITVTGTITTGDLIELTFYSPQLTSDIRLSYTVLNTDTTSTIATALAALINGNATLTNNGTTVAVATTNTLTVTWVAYLLSPLGILATVAGVPSEGTLVTSAPSSVTVSYTSAGGNSTTTIATALKNAINANAILAALGFVATSSAAVISIFYNTGLAVPTFSSSVTGSATETVTYAEANTTATITVGGTAHTGDVLTVTFTTAYGAFSVSYTMLNTDTTSTAATALEGLINASPQLAQFGIVATVSSAIVSVTWNASAGAMAITEAVTGTGNTTTLTVGGNTHGTETATYSNSGGALTNGSGPILPSANFLYTNGGYTNLFRQGTPYLVDYSTLSNMAAAGLPIT